MSLAFDLGKLADPSMGEDEYYIYGNGTMIHLPSDCGGPMGGVFAGPQPGDIGDWDICKGNPARPGLPAPIPCVPTPKPTPIGLPTLFPLPN